MDASFPRGLWPPKLRTLVIGRMKKPISKWGPQTFPTSLVELILIGGQSEDVSNFSQLSHLLPSSLTSLCIQQFEKVESVSMGLQHLTSLQHLIISNCPKMIDLPEMSYKLNLKATLRNWNQLQNCKNSLGYRIDAELCYELTENMKSENKIR
ncbi:hypothetical protein L1887_32570 [Cichorium endivia]|nr:hypothetical protein L1887_32570 [Cichorium endivia]